MEILVTQASIAFRSCVMSLSDGVDLGPPLFQIIPEQEKFVFEVRW